MRLDEVIEVFQVRHRESGELVTVDARTFDPAVHQQLDEAPAEEGAAEAEAPKGKKAK